MFCLFVFSGFHRVWSEFLFFLQSSIGFSCDFLDLIGFTEILLCCNLLGSAVLGCCGFDRVSMGFIVLFRRFIFSTGFSLIVLGVVGYDWVLLGFD